MINSVYICINFFYNFVHNFLGANLSGNEHLKQMAKSIKQNLNEKNISTNK